MKRPRTNMKNNNTLVKRRLPLKFRWPTQTILDLPVMASPVTRQVSDEDLDANGNDTDTTEKTATPRRMLAKNTTTSATAGFAVSSPPEPKSVHSVISDTSLDGKQQTFLKRRAKSMCLADLAAEADTKTNATTQHESPKSAAAAWGLFIDFPDDALRIDARCRRTPLRFRRRAPLKGFVLTPPPEEPVATIDEATQALDHLCLSRTF